MSIRATYIREIMLKSRVQSGDNVEIKVTAQATTFREATGNVSLGSRYANREFPRFWRHDVASRKVCALSLSRCVWSHIAAIGL